ncbi:SIMPL domain-containing protein [Aquabacterium humicola]|uniref:SIMPL domain-containing protein n=1 Tax=Aquabacterium humicola TaxID=3237377 RepID=UPI0025431469|nr:SIMPL domain-containing protein [Rubrivivax pictus]
MNRRFFSAVALAAAATSAAAQTAAVALPAPQNVLSLAAQASTEVPQDLLTITLAAQRDGADAAAVQSQLRQVLDNALNEARKAQRPGQLDVRTGQFALSPRYSNKGQIAGWTGRAELVLEGRDSGAISQLAGRLSGAMPVAHVMHGLSREAREKAEGDVAAQAIARFRQRAEEYARQFGFAGYSIREVNVGQADGMPPPQPMFRRAMAAQAGAVDESVPVEAGKATVTVTVNGSVQMSAR